MSIRTDDLLPLLVLVLAGALVIAAIIIDGPSSSATDQQDCPFVGFAFLVEDPREVLTGTAKMMYMCEDGTVRFEEIEK